MRRVCILVLLLGGCSPQTDWQSAPWTHKCDSEQMAKVEKETMFCADTKAYLPNYCYGTAIIRNCLKTEVKK